MKAKEAFSSIRAAIDQHPEKDLVESRYSEEVMGSFIIAYRDRGIPQAVVNDRGELCLADNFDGDDAKTVLRSIREADESEILRSLGLWPRS